MRKPDGEILVSDVIMQLKDENLPGLASRLNEVSERIIAKREQEDRAAEESRLAEERERLERDKQSFQKTCDDLGIVYTDVVAAENGWNAIRKFNPNIDGLDVGSFDQLSDRKKLEYFIFAYGIRLKGGATDVPWGMTLPPQYAPKKAQLRAAREVESGNASDPFEPSCGHRYDGSNDYNCPYCH